MTSLHLVDPDLHPLLEMMPPFPIGADNFQQMREAMFPFPDPGDDGVSIETRSVPGPAGAPDVELRIFRPTAASGPLPLIYHMHGGGYILGSVERLEPTIRPIVADLGCALVSVEYRLAPETVFPGAIEDCYAGLAWAFANAAEQGFDTDRIGVMGESAGGGLAAALALLVRDRGEHRLAFQHLIYPMLDDRTGTSSEPHDYVGEFGWLVASNRFGWESLLGHAPGIDGVSPYAAAARADNLAGLPPTFILTGALDLFLEEDLEYSRRLLRAGVPTELHVLPGAFHGFDLMASAYVSQQATQLSRAALRRFLALRS